LVAVEELTKLVPPPSQPLELGTLKQWRAIEKELGTKLPADYRGFVFAYGSGRFAGFYRVDNPFAASEYMALVPASRRWADILRQQRAGPGKDYVPFPIYPEPGGLLHWANDDNGNCYYWRTEGSPDQWTVVQDGVRGSGFLEHKCTMAEFLLRVLTKQIKPLAGAYPRKRHFVFEPWDPRETG
jgi:hypothetical protein